MGCERRASRMWSSEDILGVFESIETFASRANAPDAARHYRAMGAEKMCRKFGVLSNG